VCQEMIDPGADTRAQSARPAFARCPAADGFS
jgi:hypothetical protein